MLKHLEIFYFTFLLVFLFFYIFFFFFFFVCISSDNEDDWCEKERYILGALENLLDRIK
jgi:ABC-type multidrug transport system permease subunit